MRMELQAFLDKAASDDAVSVSTSYGDKPYTVTVYHANGEKTEYPMTYEFATWIVEVD